MRVALYPRVSTQEQAKEGYSIGEQIERLTKYCEAMNWTIYKIYTDPGYSGANTDRPGLQEMIKDVKSGLIEKVVVYKLDRLSRSQLDTLYLIEKVFLANNTDFVSMSENFDTSTPFGRAMIGILAVFAQLEREQIKERMSVGKEGRAKDGLFHGSKYVPIGYDYIDGQLIVNDYEKMQVQEVYRLFLNGTPLRTIETIFREKGYKHKFGYWTPTAMRRVMTNKTQLGYIRHNGAWYEGQHDAIIDETSHTAAVKLLNDRSEDWKKTGLRPGRQSTYLGGLLYCAHCGAKYTKQMGGSKKYGALRYYACYSRNKKVKKMIKDPNCKNKNWKAEELEDIIFNEIRKLALDPDKIHEMKEGNASAEKELDKGAAIRERIRTIDDQISRFMDLYGFGKFTIDQVSNKVDPLNEEKQRLLYELDELEQDTDALSESEAVELVSSFEDILERGNFEEIRLLIDSLISRIELDNDEVTIFWKFL